MKWYSIPGLPGYRARRDGMICGKKGKILQQSVGSNGYLTIWAKGQTRSVHALIARTFLGKRPRGLVVNHKDRNKKHNAVSNLEYTTYGFNNTGTCVGDQCSKSRLNKAQVLEIRAKHNPKTKNLTALAEEYDVWPNTIWQIVHRKSWRHI